MIYDVAIIGAGVSGALTARELSAFALSVVLLEKENDVAMGATKANSAIVHGGFDAQPGTLKAQLNVRGTAMMPELCSLLSVPFKNNGSLVVALSEDELPVIHELFDRGTRNGVPGMRILNKDELLKLEPNLSPDAAGALYATNSGIVCPYELTIAATENAVTNGVELMRNAGVSAIEDRDGVFNITTAAGEVRARYIVNAAGVYADKIANMLGDTSFNIQGRHGEYYLLDKAVGNTVTRTIFRCPTAMGKGILVTPSVDGNMLIGPTSVDVEDRDDVSTTSIGLDKIRSLTGKTVPALSARSAITSFAGIRAHETTTGDFVIGVSPANNRLINVAGIESPGLSAAPAVAEYAKDRLFEALGGVPARKSEYVSSRPEPVRFRHMSDEERQRLIESNPAYGKIVCRCETVTEGEIVDAIKAPAGALDVDGVKRRTRAGMGRCQGGFCGARVVEILARELGTEINEVTKFGRGSDILYDKTK